MELIFIMIFTLLPSMPYACIKFGRACRFGEPPRRVPCMRRNGIGPRAACRAIYPAIDVSTSIIRCYRYAAF
jgi:hypothetical protein